MEHKSVFDFLKEDDDFANVYKHCISMEKEIISESFDLSLLKGRTVCEKLIRKVAEKDSRVSYLFKKTRKDGSPDIPGLAKMLGACRKKGVVNRNLIRKMEIVKKFGDAGAHGDDSDKYDLSDCKKVHRLVFDISLEFYNDVNYPKNVSYYYDLDKFNYTIEISPEERDEELSSLHHNEVTTENIKESYKLKKIFLTVDLFKELISKYEDKFEDINEFYNNLKDYQYVNDESINDILYNVDDELKTEIISSANQLTQEKSDIIIETLNKLNEDLTFDDINDMIVSAEDNNQRDIYTFIKALSIDLVKNHLSRIKEDIENVPVTYITENGRKISKHKKYKIEMDDNGFYLENIYLDNNQKLAVEYDEKKPLVVNAGPGSGKTRILVERVVYLIKTLKKEPSSILVITYTRKATQELKNRLLNETDLPIDAVSEIKISTVHGFCRYLISTFEKVPYNYLTRYGETSLFFGKFKKELGFDNYAFLYDFWIPGVLDLYNEYFNFKVNTPQLIKYIKNQMVKRARIIEKYENYMDGFYKEYGQDSYPDFGYLLETNLNKGSYYHRFLTIASSYPKYKTYLENNKSCDDNYVLEKAYKILNREYVRNNLIFKNILIDEFQDTDFNQMKIFKKLLEFCDFEKGDTFTIVGDSDQSIYAWRGSNPEFFEDFARNPNFDCVTIHNNYRSSRNIVEFNEELIKDYRLGQKKLIPVKSYYNPVLHMPSHENGPDEAINVINFVRNLKKHKKIKYYSDVALLFRLNESIENFIPIFEEFDVPYYLTEYNDFLNQNEIKSMLTLFWLLMPYKKDKFVYRSDDFLNISWLCDDFFGLSKETHDVLNRIQDNFVKDVIAGARNAFIALEGQGKSLKYENVFRQEPEILEYIFNHVKTYDLILLSEAELVKLGITNENDLKFFSKLRSLKNLMWSKEISIYQKPDTLDLFNQLINITDFFRKVSIKTDKKSIGIKDNLALFSEIVNDYENIMGTKDYLGLFEYLNGVLEKYSCRRRDANEGFDKVHLITMHSAKGLEYPAVILCSLKDGLCPKRFKQRKYFRTPNHLLEYKPDNVLKSHIDEEMRLIYVAATRAKELLVLSSISYNNQPPAFLESLKRNRNVKIETIESHNVLGINKVSSMEMAEDVSNIKLLDLGEILTDYLFCPYRYDILNNTRFRVKLRNQKHVEKVLHSLIYSIHDQNDITSEEVNEKVQAIIKYHNLSSNPISNKIIENVNVYWEKYGRNYDIIKTNITVRKQMRDCDIKGKVDLVVKENDNEISIVQFIGSDYKIKDFIDKYMLCSYFYVSILKEYDEFKGFKFKNIILHSIDNGKRHIMPFNANYEMSTLDYLDGITTQISEEKFTKELSRCSECECNGNHC